MCQYINKPIKNYDLLKVVCGDDHATGSRAKTFDMYHGTNKDFVNLDDDTQLPNMQTPKINARSQGSQSSGSKRRRDSMGECIPDLVASLKMIGEALDTGFGGGPHKEVG